MDIEMAQKYIQIQIQDDLKYDIRIENAELESGKFYRADDRNDILTSEDVDDMVIRHNGGIRSICAMDASEGSIDLVDDVRDAKICNLTWRASTQLEDRNEIMKLHHDPRYIVNIGSWNESGNMGWIPVTVKEQD
ncbi:Aegerolysin [Penicillium italicum]|uniref:Aegerolysin n=1 Tax=Penicillium italicum TaxID=40296 RepID=A0A0A2L774_PENIT|nr:Aegerolysin [Penicillium italicum]